jgi:hypothetical protein
MYSSAKICASLKNINLKEKIITTGIRKANKISTNLLIEIPVSLIEKKTTRGIIYIIRGSKSEAIVARKTAKKEYCSSFLILSEACIDHIIKTVAIEPPEKSDV